MTIAGLSPMTVFSTTINPNGTGYTDTNPAYSPLGDNLTFQRTIGANDIESFSMGLSGEAHGNGPPQDDSYLTALQAVPDIQPNWGNTGANPGNPIPEVPYPIVLPGAFLVVGGLALRRGRNAHHTALAG